MRSIWLGSALIVFATVARAQSILEPFGNEVVTPGAGWLGFTDWAFVTSAFLTLSLASILGAVVAYHPRHGQTADSIEEIEAPKVYIIYSAIGALIGIIVVKYGLAVGFVLFGIGGLIRVRTILQSATMTGRLIFVTLIGLSCGLEMPHVAVLATVFVFILIFILDSRVTYRINIQALPKKRVAEAAAAYRTILERHGCFILSEKKYPSKERVTFIFRCGRATSLVDLEESLETGLDQSLQGALDWEVD
ncbi:MAG: hypothetical protein HKN42_05225 [Granulosicoccus sp.]|nr:hypothetical protein [Granulosicoccus sp.]